MISGAFRVRTVSLPELSSALSGMGNSRASGSDGITVQMLRATFPTIGPHLLHVGNFSLRSGEVPAGWREARVVPLFKKGDRCDPANFRTISISSVPGKLGEKCVSVQLSSYLDQNHVLYDNQHGFRCNHSTETAMIDTLNFLSSRMELGHVSIGCPRIIRTYYFTRISSLWCNRGSSSFQTFLKYSSRVIDECCIVPRSGRSLVPSPVRLALG